MGFYAITKQDEEDFTPPVFHAGDDEEAIGIFTSEARAEEYLAAAGWQATDEVAELEPFDLLLWLFEAYRQGANYLVIDPDLDHATGGEQNVLLLEDELQQFAEIAASDVWAARKEK